MECVEFKDQCAFKEHNAFRKTIISRLNNTGVILSYLFCLDIITSFAEIWRELLPKEDAYKEHGDEKYIFVKFTSN